VIGKGGVNSLNECTKERRESTLLHAVERAGGIGRRQWGTQLLYWLDGEGRESTLSHYSVYSWSQPSISRPVERG
jgi:hypothetical protein